MSAAHPVDADPVEQARYPDLLSLPRNVSGPKATTYWGMIWLIVIEATVIGWLVLSYFYLRIEAVPTWPPPGIDHPEVLLSGVATGILLLSALPVYFAVRGIRRGQQAPIRLGFPMGLLMVATYIVLTGFDARGRTYDWATHAYGSIVWTITGYQLLHAATLLAFGGAILIFAFRGRYDANQHRGIEAAALYWYFVALAGVPAYATVYLAPYLL